RWVLAVSRDLLPFLPGLSSVQQQWSTAAEIAADQCAAQSGQGIDLASALVRIARMVPNGARASIPAGALLVYQDSATIALRVESLLASNEVKESSETQSGSLLSIAVLATVSAVFLWVLLTATQLDLLGTVHELIEYAVEALK